jgi:hypothetical protein
VRRNTLHPKTFRDAWTIPETAALHPSPEALPLPSSRGKALPRSDSVPRPEGGVGCAGWQRSGAGRVPRLRPRLTYADACCAGCRTRATPLRFVRATRGISPVRFGRTSAARRPSPRSTACAAGVGVREPGAQARHATSPRTLASRATHASLWAQRGIATAQGDSRDEGNGKPRGGGRAGEGGHVSRIHLGIEVDSEMCPEVNRLGGRVANPWRCDGPREWSTGGAKRNASQPKHLETIGPFLRQRFSTLPPRRGKGRGWGPRTAISTGEQACFGDVSRAMPATRGRACGSGEGATCERDPD